VYIKNSKFRSIVAFGAGVYAGQEYAGLPRIRTIVHHAIQDLQAKIKEYEDPDLIKIDRPSDKPKKS